MEFERFFADEEALQLYLEQLRWPEGFRCPQCSKATPAWRSGRGLLICTKCRQQGSVTVGTIFEKTRKPDRVEKEPWVVGEGAEVPVRPSVISAPRRAGLRSEAGVARTFGN